jgi:glutathione S-transferase
MPVLTLEDGTVLQDSSEIIDQLELMYPSPSIQPPGSTQQLVSALLELYGDEWLPIISMHTRWNIEGNPEFAVAEFGRCALPWVPSFFRNRLVQPIATKMSNYRRTFGINEETGPEIDRWLSELLGQLDAHFATYPYLLGGRPCLGDFSIYGPLYAHVWRDPASRDRVEPHTNVMAWIKRMRTPDQSKGKFLADDAVPETLFPILARMFQEQLPVLHKTVAALSIWLDNNPDVAKVPRGLGTVSFRIGEVEAERTMMSYQQWQFQRPLTIYRTLETTDKERADSILERTGGFDAMQLQPKYTLVRKGFRVLVDR